MRELLVAISPWPVSCIATLSCPGLLSRLQVVQWCELSMHPSMLACLTRLQSVRLLGRHRGFTTACESFAFASILSIFREITSVVLGVF